MMMMTSVMMMMITATKIWWWRRWRRWRQGASDIWPQVDLLIVREWRSIAIKSSGAQTHTTDPAHQLAGKIKTYHVTAINTDIPRLFIFIQSCFGGLVSISSLIVQDTSWPNTFNETSSSRPKMGIDKNGLLVFPLQIVWLLVDNKY